MRTLVEMAQHSTVLMTSQLHKLPKTMTWSPQTGQSTRRELYLNTAAKGVAVGPHCTGPLSPSSTDARGQTLVRRGRVCLRAAY